MASAVRDIDHGADALVRRVKLLSQSPRVVDVGILGDQAGERKETPEGEPPADATLGEIASYHELGIGQIPRPFIRGYVDAHRDKIEDRIRMETRRLLLGKTKTGDEAMERLGAWIQGQIQGWLRNPGNNLEPLTPETIIRKGSAQVLIDTGQIRSAIAYLVRNRSEGV